MQSWWRLVSPNLGGLISYSGFIIAGVLPVLASIAHNEAAPSRTTSHDGNATRSGDSLDGFLCADSSNKGSALVELNGCSGTAMGSNGTIASSAVAGGGSNISSSETAVCHGCSSNLSASGNLFASNEFYMALVNACVEVVSMTASYGLILFGLRYFFTEMDPNRDQKRNSLIAKQRLQNKIIASGRKPFEMNEYEMMVTNDMVYPEDIDVSFNMIGGLEKTKREIFEIVALPLLRPDLFAKSSLITPPKGILLYGPPGTGKTMMAKAIAKESGAAFINLQMSTTMNKWFGESQKLVRATFTLAWKLAPCVIFIDEIDAFLSRRSEDDHAAHGSMKAEFMALWDGMLTQDMIGDNRPYGVIVIGATNRPEIVDEAILRRMPRSFKLALPDLNQRHEILKLTLQNESISEELRSQLPSLAEKLVGYSGSDIKELCQAAAMRPFREYAASCCVDNSFEGSENVRSLVLSDFLEATQDVGATGQAAYEYAAEVTACRAAGIRF